MSDGPAPPDPNAQVAHFAHGARGVRAERAQRWLVPLLPALLAGAHATGLLLFLNPHLPVSLAALARGTALYGALLAPLSLAAHALVARRKRRRGEPGVPARRLLPWGVMVVVAAGALGDWVHASVYAFYLPPAINQQLIKTALWLTLGAILLFYTSLLHTLHRRRYGARSRALVALVALGTVYAMFDRRTSARPLEVPPPRWVEVEPEAAPRLVVVVVPGATLDLLLPLAEQGKLPAVAALLQSGSSARLGGFAPVRREALVASWATAKLPFRHGVTGAEVHEPGPLGVGGPLRLLPLGVGFEFWGLPGGHRRAIEARDRTALPVWEILSRAGRESRVGGFSDALADADLRFAPATRELPPLVAQQALAESGWSALAGALAADRRRLAPLRARLAAPDSPAASFVQLDGLEQAALATAGGFVAAEFEGSRAGEARRAADALTTYLAGLDAELAVVWQTMAPPRLLVVTSPWGVAAPSGAARFVGDLTFADRVEGTLAGPPDGVWLARGEHVRPGVRLADARLVDVAPTLLYALGLPVARDFDGRVLAEAFEPALLQRRALAFVPSFEGLPDRPAVPAGALTNAAPAP